MAERNAVPIGTGSLHKYFILPEFHLDVRESPAQSMEWNAVVYYRIHIVRLVVAHNDIAGQAQCSENGFGNAAVVITGDRNMPRS